MGKLSYLLKRSLKRFTIVYLADIVLSTVFLSVPIDDESLFDSFSDNETLYDIIEFGTIDIFTLHSVRFVLLLLMLVSALLLKLEQYQFKFFYWTAFTATILILGKAIVFDYTEDAISSLFVVFTTLFSFLEFYQIGFLFKKPEKTVSLTEAVESLSFKQLFNFIKPYFFPKGCWNKLRSATTFVFLILSRVFNLLSPIYIGRAVDALNLAVIDKNEVFINIILFSMFKILARVFSELQRVSYLKIGQIAFVEISEKTFIHLHNLSLDWHLKKKLGKVLRYLNRGVSSINSVVRLVFLNLLPTLLELLAVFFIFYTEFNVPKLSAVLTIAIIFYITLTVQITNWRKKYRRLTNKHDNDYHDKATDSLINYETVKYFTNEAYETKKYIESIDKYQQNQNLTTMTLALLNSTQTMIIQLSVMSALLIVTTEVVLQNGDLTIGDFVTVQVYMAQVFTPLSFLGTIYDTVVQAFVDISNLSELLANTPDIQDSPDASEFQFEDKPIPVTFNNVTFVYPSNNASGLRNVHFEVNPGEKLAIIGHTGAGKTTIGRLLFRFYDPVSGSIEFSHQDIRNFTQQSVRRAIGVVPQDTILFNDTIWNNLVYGKLDATEEEVRNACDAAQILDFIEDLPEKFETSVGERGLRLSGGEKQRIAIARCLLKNPPIVLLDEATSALDNKTEKKVQLALDTLTEYRTTLIIAHRLSTIRHADKIIVLDKGRIVERGNHDSLIQNKNGEYYKLWKAQRQQSKEQEHVQNL